MVSSRLHPWRRHDSTDPQAFGGQGNDHNTTELITEQ